MADVQLSERGIVRERSPDHFSASDPDPVPAQIELAQGSGGPFEPPDPSMESFMTGRLQWGADPACAIAFQARSSSRSTVLTRIERASAVQPGAPTLQRRRNNSAMGPPHRDPSHSVRASFCFGSS
eukprot:3197602-Rhodomonas_salina.2